MLVALKPLDHVCSDRLEVPLVEFSLKSSHVTACKVKLNAALRLQGNVAVANRNFKWCLCHDLLEGEVSRMKELYLLSRSRKDKGERLFVEAWHQLEVVDENVELVDHFPVLYQED